MAKELYVQAAELKGKRDDKQSIFSHQYTPATDNLKNSRGSLYALVQVRNVSENQAIKIDKEVFQTFQSHYYSSTVGGVLAALESAYEQTEASFKEMEKDSEARLDFISAVLWAESLYLVKSQSMGVVFQRGEAVKELRFNKAASGAIRDKDAVFLGNRSFLENYSLEDIKNAQTKTEFEERASYLKEKAGQIEGVEALMLGIFIEEPRNQQVEMVEIEEKSNVERLLVGLKTQAERFLPFLSEKIYPHARSAKKMISEYLNKLLNFILKPWKPRQPGELDDPVKIRRARAAQVAVALILLLSLSVGFALVNRSNSAKQAAFEEELSNLEAALVEVENLLDINPDRANELLSVAGESLEKAKGYSLGNQKLDGLTLRLAMLVGMVNQVYEPEFEEVYSFDGGIVADMVGIKKELVVLDKSSGKVYLLNKATQELREVSIGGGPNELALSDSTPFLQAEGGIWRLNLGSLSTAKIQERSDLWGKIVDSATYQGNFYLLDSEKGEVWKYLSAGDFLSQPQPYFSAGKPPGNMSAVAIDGLVWVGNDKGQITKFLAGRKQDFEIKGLDKPLGEIEEIFTTVESSNLYVLDKGNGRVVLLDKNGDYVSQYISSEFAKAAALFVDEKTKEIFVGVEGSIKKFSFD